MGGPLGLFERGISPNCQYRKVLGLYEGAYFKKAEVRVPLSRVLWRYGQRRDFVEVLGTGLVITFRVGAGV